MTTNDQPRKGQTGEPTNNGGHFGSKSNDEAEAKLPAQSLPDAIMADVQRKCTDAGFSTAMPGVYEVIFDRDGWDEWSEGFGQDLTAKDVTADYDEYIEEAVTKLAYALMSRTPDGPYDDSIRDGAEEKIRALCDDHGYGGVMPGLIDAALDRHEWAPSVITATLNLDHTDFESIYNDIVGPAIDDLEDSVKERSCKECGESADDGEGEDGWCGNCADKNTCSSCFERLNDDGECTESGCEGPEKDD